jgi:hypothetical protein
MRTSRATVTYSGEGDAGLTGFAPEDLASEVVRDATDGVDVVFEFGVLEFGATASSCDALTSISGRCGTK